MVMLIITGILFAGYALLVLFYWKSWTGIPVFTPSSEYPSEKISVIIPARNEEAVIARLLDALQAQDYPRSLFEIIVVDDHSTDQTADIVQRYSSVRLVSLGSDPGNSYKKKALETGIAAATGEWILTTDADCIPAAGWIRTLAACIRDKEPLFIVAPVYMEPDDSLVQTFQSMDFLMLQAITGAVVNRNLLTMCNGANIAYRKSVFLEVQGFSGIDSIASGDDMLLMYKIWKKYPDRISYLLSPEVVVTTKAEPDWPSFFRQRIRWASKAAKYQDKRFFPILLWVYVFNLSLLIILIAGFSSLIYLGWFGIFWVAKMAVEWPLYNAASRFFDKSANPIIFFLLQPLHMIYILVSGFFGQVGSYYWKGRKVR